MKNSIKTLAALGLVALVSIGCSGNSKAKDVPAEVKAGFSAAYPGVKNVSWDKEDGKYEAGFKENNRDVSVLIEANGTVIQTERDMEVSSLPQSITDYVKTNLGGKKIDEAAKIITKDGTVSYEAEVGGDDYIFDASGKLMKKDIGQNKTDNEDNEDDEANEGEESD